MDANETVPRARTAGALALVLALGVMARTPAARADDLTVLALEQGSWPAAVAALQADVASEGRAVHVYVQDDAGRRLGCGTYALQLDAAASEAFALGPCTTDDDATAVQLVRRAALFDHEDAVPQPRAVGITAVQVRVGTASGGARSVGGSEVTCSVAVRPYLNDMEHGTRVFLQPGRYVLRPSSAAVVAQAGGSQWLLTAHAAATLSVEYDVVDTAVVPPRVLLHDRATLACDTAPVSAAAGSAPDAAVRRVSMAFATRCEAATELVSGRRVHGSTALGVSGGNTCGSLASRRRDYVLRVPVRSNVELALHSAFDGTLALRSGCDPDGVEVRCNDDDGDTTHSRIQTTLEPGLYTVRVAGFGDDSRGDFDLTTAVAPADEPGASDEPLPELRFGTSVYGSTVGRRDEHQASCGGWGYSPDRTYVLRVAGPARVRVHVAVDVMADYDAVVYVRWTTDPEDRREVVCNDDDRGDRQHARVEADLAPGTYYVVVDGHGSGNVGNFQLTAHATAL